MNAQQRADNRETNFVINKSFNSRTNLCEPPRLNAGPTFSRFLVFPLSLLLLFFVIFLPDSSVSSKEQLLRVSVYVCVPVCGWVCTYIE